MNRPVFLIFVVSPPCILVTLIKNFLTSTGLSRSASPHRVPVLRPVSVTSEVSGLLPQATSSNKIPISSRSGNLISDSGFTSFVSPLNLNSSVERAIVW